MNELSTYSPVNSLALQLSSLFFNFCSIPLIIACPIFSWPLEKLHAYFKDDTLALIGYGSQGHGQGLNARDNGMNVIIGVREGGESWKQAQEDGWVSLNF
jgi:hypothetical protein